MKVSKNILLCVLSSLLLLGCGDITNPSNNGEKFYNVEVTKKEISKEEYVNKTLGGLLGQFAGFLSGYEFVWNGPGPYIGIPKSWYEFLNGPYAGNYTHYYPQEANEEYHNRYDRLKINEETGRNEIWTDDDFHIDIFNQLILDEAGFSSYAIKETWKKYKVSDWGGGLDAMNLINKNDMLAPFTGTIEAGNRYGWCTEAYIENETLGMNAPGMPNVATLLIDKFASNVGYFDSVVWGKFYGAMYSIAYFENDIKVVMEKAKDTLPEHSYPRQMFDAAYEAYNKYPGEDGYKLAAQEIADKRRNLYRLDNIQTDPNVNGAYAVLSWLYGNNSYLDTCMYASIMGYDGDCTAAITQGVMGILKGFKEGNEEYQAINDNLYYNGEGVYYNDRLTGFPPHFKSDEYPLRQDMDDIVSLYQKNFEKILVENGGEITEDKYIIPTTPLYKDHSYLFENCDAELRDTTNFESKNGTFQCLTETENISSHTGWGYFHFNNTKNGEVYHKYTNLIKGRTYRFTSYCTTGDYTQVEMFARSGNEVQSITFSNVASLINKELIFKATSSTMEVGFKFDDKQTSDAFITFDDYFVEEIQRDNLSEVQSQDIKLTANKLIKSIKKPENVKIGQEVILSIEVRSYANEPIFATLNRNNNMYGGVVITNSSINSLSGKAYLDIPYIFEKDTDAINLLFDGYKLGIGDINIYNQTQYLFR